MTKIKFFDLFLKKLSLYCSSGNECPIFSFKFVLLIILV